MEGGGVNITHHIMKFKHFYYNWCNNAAQRFLNDLTLIKKENEIFLIYKKM